MDPDSEAARAGGHVIAEERPLPALVELAPRI
jgi:hypothetical protein